MTDGILIVMVAVVAMIAGGALALMWLRRSDPDRAAVVAEALAAVARAVSSTMTEAEIRAIASWIYDNSGVSKYYTRAAWIQFCLRIIPRAAPAASQARAAWRVDGV